MGRLVTNWSFLPPPTKRQKSPLISVVTNIAAFLLHDQFIDQPDTQRFIVVLLNFLTGIDGPIWPAHRDSARLSNPPTGRILPLKCTPLNKAAAPLPGGIRPHLNTRTSNIVLRWGERGGFGLLHPEAL
jgi:hypothetical protein